MSSQHEMIVSDEALSYILFQRTQYLENNIFFKGLTLFGLVKPFYKASVALKVQFFKGAIKKAFSDDMHAEFETFKNSLPHDTKAVLDIGCGVAGVDVLISDYYQHHSDIYLLDKTSIDQQVYYGFKDKGSVYNSLAVSVELLKQNNVPVEHVHTQEATEHNNITFSQEFDVILSLISWGYHYPVSTYLTKVYDLLQPGGVLIIDIRKATSGEDEIEKVFGNKKVIFSMDSFNRIVAVK